MATSRAQPQLAPTHHVSEQKRHILQDYLEDLDSGEIERRRHESERAEEHRTHRSPVRRLLPAAAAIAAIVAVLAVLWIVAAALDDPGPRHAPWATPSAPDVRPPSLQTQ